MGRFGEYLVPSSWVDVSRYTSIASGIVGFLDVTEGLGSWVMRGGHQVFFAGENQGPHAIAEHTGTLPEDKMEILDLHL